MSVARTSRREARSTTLEPDNLFAQMGVPDAEERQLKATLVTRIRAAIADRALTQTQAGTIMGLPQPEVSELVSGGASGFSAERLFTLLNRLGVSVQIAFAVEENYTPAKTSFAWGSRNADGSPRYQLEDAQIARTMLGAGLTENKVPSFRNVMPKLGVRRLPVCYASVSRTRSSSRPTDKI